MAAKKGGYYVVKAGRHPGVYKSWDEAKAHVSGYSGAIYKKVASMAAAESFLEAPTRQGESATKFYQRFNASSGSSSSAVGSAGRSNNRSAGGNGLANAITHNGAPHSSAPHSSGSYGTITHTSTNTASESQLQIQHVYTDGASRNNGRDNAAAGWGVFYGPNDPRNKAAPLESGPQTNQRAELNGVYFALQNAKKQLEAGNPTKTVIHTDSQYTRKALTEWSDKWTQNGWISSTGGPVQNKDIIEPAVKLRKELDQAYMKVGIKDGLEIRHVKGHNGDVGNEAADQLANLGVDMNYRSLSK